MKNNSTPPLNLLDEYGLNQTTYRLLSLARGGPLSWASPDHHARLKQISGTPAASIRKLIDRKLLTGPARGEKIHSRLIGLTATGLDTLERIERGLHRPDWISEARSRVLARMVSNEGDLFRAAHTNDGLNLTTLRSLAKHGYIEQVTSIYWRITPLGREAWTEYNNHNQTGGTQ